MKSSHTDPKTSGCPIDAIENSHSWRNPSFPSSPVFSQALLGINLGFQLLELLAGGEGEPAPAPQRRFSWLAGCCQVRAFLLVLRGLVSLSCSAQQLLGRDLSLPEAISIALHHKRSPNSLLRGIRGADVQHSVKKGQFLTREMASSQTSLRNSLSYGDRGSLNRLKSPCSLFYSDEAMRLQQLSQPAATFVSCFQVEFPTAHCTLVI